MPEKFVGLDIGAGSVKAVLLVRGFRGGGRVTAFSRVGIAEAGGVAEALTTLFSDPAFAGAICLSSLSSALFSYRNVQLPFSDSRKIAQTIAFAVEPLIRQPLDSVLIDHVVAGKGKQTKVFAAIADRSLIDDRRSLMAPHVRELATLDVDAVPLASFLLQKPDFPVCALLLDIGLRDTTAVFAGRGGIFLVRHFYFGGQEAADSMALFFTELKNTISFLQQKGQIPELPTRIILTGGASRMPGLSAGLAEHFGAPVDSADLLAAGGFAMDDALRASWDGAVMDQALALAARPTGKGTGFNFLKREQETRVDSGEMRGIIRKGAIAAGVIAVLAAIELGLGDYAMRLHLARLKKDVIAEFKKIDPEATKIVDPVVQLKGKIAESRKLTAGVGEALASSSALDMFRDISTAAQPEIVLSNLSLDDDAISLKGEAPNFDAMDAFKKKLEGSKYVKSVTVGSTSLLKEGKGVEFNLKAARKR
jgi:hypothetical protein